MCQFSFQLTPYNIFAVTYCIKGFDCLNIASHLFALENGNFGMVLEDDGSIIGHGCSRCSVYTQWKNWTNHVFAKWKRVEQRYAFYIWYLQLFTFDIVGQHFRASQYLSCCTRYWKLLIVTWNLCNLMSVGYLCTGHKNLIMYWLGIQWKPLSGFTWILFFIFAKTKSADDFF